jgi:transcriptional regulator of acetoin/glycerol metabolism
MINSPIVPPEGVASREQGVASPGRRRLLGMAAAAAATLVVSQTLVACGSEARRSPLRLDDLARERILQGAWPGNVRELANALERAAILAESYELRGDDLRVSMTLPTAGSVARSMVDIEREAIRRALDEADGNRRRAAQQLGIGERTLYDELKRYGMS